LDRYHKIPNLLDLRIQWIHLDYKRERERERKRK
jgi:hypothetical protein